MKLQYCECCQAPTGKCEEDSLFWGEIGPLCETCFDEIKDTEITRIVQTIISTGGIQRLQKTRDRLLEALEIAKDIIDENVDKPTLAGYSNIENAIAEARGEA